MKKLGILLLLMSMILLSCVRKVEKPVEAENDFLKIPEYKTEPYTPPSTYTPIYQTQTSSMTPTYWYVTFEEIRSGKDENNIDWHRALQLETPYFDFIAARKALPSEVTGECYFDFIIQINKESFESYQKYRIEYFK